MVLQIRFGRYDPEAKADSTVTLTDAKPWSAAAELKTDGIMPGNFMTCEHNYVILDGTMAEFPDDPSQHQWGWFSDSMSDDNGEFASPPTMDIAFTVNHRSPGLTLLSYPLTEDYPKDVRVTWFDASNAVIHAGVYQLPGKLGAIRESVANFRRIKLEVLSTHIPKRYVKLYGLEYGISEVFSDGEIVSEQLSEDIDPISDTISVNRFRFNIKTHNAAFSLISGNLADNMLMKKQKLDLLVDDNPYGTFFLDSWGDNDGSGVSFNFSAVDAIGVMGTYRFYGGLYSNMPVGQLLDAVFAVAFPTGLIGYTLDDDLTGTVISGYIPICTCREALQYICFAIGAVADTSRRGYVWIYRRDTVKSFDLPLERIYLGSPVSPTDYYSGVDITAYSYQQTSEETSIFNGVLSPGVHVIEFTEPCWGVTASGATIQAAHINYAVVSVTARATVTITGRRYNSNANVYSIRDTVEAGEVESIAVFEGCTLVNLDNVEALISSVFDYLKYRIRMTADIRVEGIECGFLGDVSTRGLPVRGIVESLSGSVRAGRAKAVIVGSLVEG